MTAGHSYTGKVFMSGRMALEPGVILRKVASSLMSK